MSSDSDQDLGITERKQYNTGEWYAEVVQKAGLANYGPEGMSRSDSDRRVLDKKHKHRRIQRVYSMGDYFCYVNID
ncbi:MAG: hypothetical protein R6V31_10270 [Halohasta sp.]